MSQLNGIFPSWMTICLSRTSFDFQTLIFKSLLTWVFKYIKLLQQISKLSWILSWITKTFLNKKYGIFSLWINVLLLCYWFQSFGCKSHNWIFYFHSEMSFRRNYISPSRELVKWCFRFCFEFTNIKYKSLDFFIIILTFDLSL